MGIVGLSNGQYYTRNRMFDPRLHVVDHATLCFHEASHKRAHQEKAGPSPMAHRPQSLMRDVQEPFFFYFSVVSSQNAFNLMTFTRAHLRVGSLNQVH